jgi:large subunit ribosomal protein L25
MHPYKGHVQHIDFQRVSKDKKIHMKVPLHFVNAEVSPGVKEQGGIPNHVLNELDVICLPDDLPVFIEVDMGQLTIGHSVHVRELKLPKGVEAVLHKGENPVVATIIQPVLITEEETTAEVVSAADVPATEQAAPDKDAAAGGDKAAAKPGDKAADKGGKPAEKPAEKKEKK